MHKYSTVLQRTAALANSFGSINCTATTRRGRIYDVMFGSEGSVADNPFLWTMDRITTVGTRTSVTPTPLDPADSACVTASGQNHTSTEPTYTASTQVLYVPLNQRATFRWVASPDGELVFPATANNGFGIRTPTSGAVAATATLHFEE